MINYIYLCRGIIFDCINMNDLNLPVILFDDADRRVDLLPLAFTRPIADFRVGISTLREKWEAFLPGSYYYHTVDYLAARVAEPPVGDALYINSSVLPDEALAAAVARLEAGSALVAGEELLAFRGVRADFDARRYESVEYGKSFDAVRQLYDIFTLNGKAITDDFRRLTAGCQSGVPDASCVLIGPNRLDDDTPSIYIGEGATVCGAFINTTEGPVYIAPGAKVMEGSMLRGPLAVCEGATVNMGSKVYGSTTIGPKCKVGGEVNNVVFFGFSNKAHDGFLGNAVIGEWCNIGAGTNASNLKNDYSPIRLWNYRRHTFARTGMQFCGLIMGDHSKAGINCMFNTATVVGVGVNIHGSGFPRTFIPSFSAGSPVSGFADLPLSKFYETAERVMARRGLVLTDADRVMFEHIYEQSAQFK